MSDGSSQFTNRRQLLATPELVLHHLEILVGSVKFLGSLLETLPGALEASHGVPLSQQQ